MLLLCVKPPGADLSSRSRQRDQDSDQKKIQHKTDRPANTPTRTQASQKEGLAIIAGDRTTEQEGQLAVPICM